MWRFRIIKPYALPPVIPTWVVQASTPHRRANYVQGRRRLIEQDSSTTFHRRGRQLLQSNFFELDGLTFQVTCNAPEHPP